MALAKEWFRRNPAVVAEIESRYAEAKQEQRRRYGLGESNIEVRSAARLVLIDADQRLLLFRHADGHGREFWATPGGGIEAGETAEQAAHREAAEELGAAEVELVPLWTGHSNFMFADRRISQAETFFLVTRHSGILGPGLDELHHREGIIELRWWSVEEVENAAEPVFPSDLANRIKEHLRNKPPSQSWEL
jgi:ADP-ribose pyrophosphatase YjhB (NUDIX family)